MNTPAPEKLYVVVDKFGKIRHTYVDEFKALECADEPQYYGGSWNDEPWHVVEYTANYTTKKTTNKKYQRTINSKT
jgi:hypothetical protein